MKRRSFDTEIHYSRTGRPTGDRYRYISDEDALYGERYRYIDDNTYKIVNYRYRGERTQLTVNGSIAAQATSDDCVKFSSQFRSRKKPQILHAALNRISF